MRDIKYRGKRIDNGEWAAGDLVHWRNEENTIQIIQENFGCCVNSRGDIVLIEEPFCCKVIPETVGQFTGLRDKNGKEIYEGDIVKVKMFDGYDPSTGMNKYIYETFEIKILNDKRPYNFKLVDECGDEWSFDDTSEIEVIGDIHNDEDSVEVQK